MVFVSGTGDILDIAMQGAKQPMQEPGPHAAEYGTIFLH